MRDENCIFCKIAAGEIPSATVYEDEDFRAILDLSPASRGHALILPKEHFKDITEADEAVAARIPVLAANIGKAMKKGLRAKGFNIVINTGEAAGQTVFHCHVHIIPRYEADSTMVGWKPGKSEPAELAETARLIGEAYEA